MPTAEITQTPPPVQTSTSSASDTPAPNAPDAPTPDAPEGDFLSSLTSKLREAAEGKTPEEPKEEPKAGDAPEKKDEPKADGDEPVPKNLTPAAEAKWKEIRAEAKQARTEAAELKAKLAEYEPRFQERESKIKELEGATARLADLDRMKEQIAEYEGELAIARIEATPEFKRSVLQPMAKIMEHADRLSTKYPDVSRDKIVRALNEPDSDKQADMIAEFATEWREKDRVDLYTLGNDYQKLSDRRNEMQQNASEALKQIQEREAQDQQAAVAETKAEWNRATITTWDKVVAPIIKDLPEEEAAKIKGSVANLDFSKESANGRAYAAYSAMLLPRVVKDLTAAIGKNKELEAKIASLQKAKPSGGQGDSIETKKSDESDTRSFLDAVTSVIPK